jgi:hypothetical protein
VRIVGRHCRRLVPWPAARLNLGIMSAAYLVIGASLFFQPGRWEATPAYHVLLEIFPAAEWGRLFIAAGTLLACAVIELRRRRWVVVIALMWSIALTAGWMLSFVARYLTSGATTPETWVSWAVFLYLLLSVAASLDDGAAPTGR